MYAAFLPHSLLYSIFHCHPTTQATHRMRMASASSASSPTALLPFANSTTTTTTSTPTSHTFLFFKTSAKPSSKTTFRLRAPPTATQGDAECNTEECAPDKEVGKVSMEWLAGEKTKVVGTFPPRKQRNWSGYVEKDTAGQTNIYSVEPVVYVAESAISSGTAGTSSSGTENTAAIAAFIGLISVAAASSIILQLGKSPVQIQTTKYSGPSLNYYINKFKSEEIVPASPAPSIVEASAQVEQETPPEEISTSDSTAEAPASE